MPRKEIAGLSFGKKLLKAVILAELAAFLGCYLFYSKTNRDPEFRYKLYTSGATGFGILEAYYKLGETLNSELKIKEHDLDLWQKQGKRT